MPKVVKERPKNESAFPVVHPNPYSGSNYVLAWGMTLRDYFAAAALQGLMARGSLTRTLLTAAIAKTAYDQADAMLLERNKE